MHTVNSAQGDQRTFRLPSSAELGCTHAKVAIMTAGSFVLILASRGTSFSVRVNLSRVVIIEWKQMRVLGGVKPRRGERLK